MGGGIQEVITAENIKTVDFDTLVAFIAPIYAEEVPQFATDKTHHLSTLADCVVYFSNNYSFIMELWAICISQVRELRHAKAPTAEIGVAMDKRDYLDRVLSSLKLKYHACVALLRFYDSPDYKTGI